MSAAHAWAMALRPRSLPVAVSPVLTGAALGWLRTGAIDPVAALAYMGGPRPIAYTPFGELTVFVFFGLVAVAGTDWVLTRGVGLATVLAAVANGGIAASALAVNNHRDRAHDAQAGRSTFAVRFGPGASRALHALLLLGPFALVPGLVWATGTRALLLPLLLAPAAWRLQRDFAHCAPGLAYNAILFRTFKLQLGFGVLLAVGAVGGGLM